MTPRRFYKLVHTDPCNKGHGIFLDGRPVRTRMGATLTAPNKAIAAEIVKEWAAQGDEIQPDTMPFTQILNTRIDRVETGRPAMTVALLKYLDTDLVCYPAPEPQPLQDSQERKWRPFIAWFEGSFGHSLNITTGLRAVAQPEELKTAVRKKVEAFDHDSFTILQWVTALAGSLVIGLAFMEERSLTARHILEARFVEDDYKEELYNAAFHGPDPLIDAARKQTETELSAAQRYLELLEPAS